MCDSPRVQLDMTKFLFFIDELSTWVGKAFAWLILVLTLGVSYEVFVRYVLRAPTTWAFDISYITYGAMFLMAGAYTLSRNGHVRADVVYRLWSPRTQATMDLVLYILFFLPAIGALMYSGWNYAADVDALPRSQHLQSGRRAGLSAEGADPGHRFPAVSARASPKSSAACCASAPARWPQRLHDVEETESLVIREQQQAAAQQGEKGSRRMTDPQLGMLMLGLFIFIIMLGFPIAFTLMAMGVGFGYYAYYTPGQDFFQNRIFTLLVQKTFEVTSSDVLVAVPLFLFMGYVVERANILDRLFYSLQLSMKNVPGALAVATLITCAMFATATGIVGAVVTLMGLLALPAMLRAGYDIKLSAGVVCAGGCLGILIPPSILLIVYAATAGVSAVKLYAAAFIPGFLLAGLLRPLCDRARDHQSRARAEAAAGADRRAVSQGNLGARDVVPAACVADRFGARRDPVRPGDAVRGGRGRRAQAASFWRPPIGALNYEMMRESVYLTVRATAMVCYLFIGSWTFSAVFAVLGGQTVVEQFFPR